MMTSPTQPVAVLRLTSFLALFLLAACAGQAAPLQSWTAAAGEWAGHGIDAGGAFEATASVELLYGGRFLVWQSTETRPSASPREEVRVYAPGEKLLMLCYGVGDDAMRQAAGSGEGADLDVADSRGRLVLRRQGDGLLSVVYSGATTESSRCQFSRRARGIRVQTVVSSASRDRTVRTLETTTGGPGLGPIPFLTGQFTGEGTDSEGAFTAAESCVLGASGAVQISRQKLDHGQRGSRELLAVYGVRASKPFRHAFASNGTFQLLDGAWQGASPSSAGIYGRSNSLDSDFGLPPILDAGRCPAPGPSWGRASRVSFEAAQGAGRVVLSIVGSRGGYKLESRLVTPGAPDQPLLSMTMAFEGGSGTSR